MRPISGVKGILFLRKMYRSIDCYGNISDIWEHMNRHHRKSVISGNQHFSVMLAAVCELYSFIEGCSIAVFGPEISFVSYGTEFKNIVSSK